jgi:membrane protein implicated in regulation of membrane protease activity
VRAHSGFIRQYDAQSWGPRTRMRGGAQTAPERDDMESMWWFIGAVVLGVAEVFTLDLTLLMCSGGALAGGFVAFFDGPWWLAALVAIVTALLLLFALRPFLLKSLREKTPLVETNVAAVVGKTGTALSEVTEHKGRAKIAGEVWSARTEDGAPAIAEDAKVKVLRIRGAIAVVEAH